MDTASNLLFILFALVAAYNLCAWLMQKHILPLIGFILFALACILRAEAAPALWLFLFADAGTWLLCLLLIPACIQDLREKNRFTLYAIYQNDKQILKLYRSKGRQIFEWEYTADIQETAHPMLSGFTGDWTISAHQIQLLAGNEIITIADIQHDDLMFEENINPHYDFLAKNRLTTAHSIKFYSF